MSATVETTSDRSDAAWAPLPPPRGAAPRRGRARLVRRALIAADVAALAGAYAGVQAVAGAGWPAGGELAGFLVLLPCWVVAAGLSGLYGADDQRIDHSTADEVVAIVLLATVADWALLAVAHATGRAQLAGRLLLFWLLAAGAVTAVRALTRALLRRSVGFRQRVLILGADETAQLVARKLRQHAEYGLDVLGFVDGRTDGASERIGTPSELPELVRAFGVERVVVTLDGRPPEETLATIRSLYRLGVYVDLVPGLHELIGPNGRIHAIEGLALIDVPPARLSGRSRLLKRVIDVVGALVGLLLAAPIFLVVPVLIRRESPGPSLFRQRRLGEQMREFTVLKFRTMRLDVDDDRHRDFIRATMDATATPEQNGLYKLEQPEVTRLGAFLRRTSLDELPQLVNILRGEMSLVGPRPCIPYETQFFRPHHFERFSVPAGLTGLWQVAARAHSTFGEALDMDVAYARGWSLGLDLNLLLRTVRQVLTRKGTA